MNNTDPKTLIVTPVAVLLGLAAAFAGGQAGSRVLGIPVLVLLVGLAFIIQWLAFIPAYRRQTEKFYDLTGSLTFISVITLALFLSRPVDGRGILMWALVVIWAVRLGAFLSSRIKKSGKDDRFDEIKTSFVRFLNAWTLQGLWVSLTLLSALIPIAAADHKELDFFALLGTLVWVCGFAIEVGADIQKSRFKADPQNRGRFIRTGLWARSRHPNYFGEITLWLGILIIGLPVLHGWQWVALISPIFVALLITRVSGVPQLEKKADQNWGGQADYEAYKRDTPVLVPRLVKPGPGNQASR